MKTFVILVQENQIEKPKELQIQADYMQITNDGKLVFSRAEPQGPPTPMRFINNSYWLDARESVVSIHN